MNKLYYENRNVKFYLGDSFEILDELDEKFVDLIFVDLFYFFFNNGIIC